MSHGVNVPDFRPRRGQLPIEEAMCWNHMTPGAQEYLASMGIVDEYGGGPCNNRAEVKVDIGDEPGPRFYCRPCAEQATL